MFERHGLKKWTGILQSELQKTVTKAKKSKWEIGNGEYNLIKYVRCLHHTRCPVQILTFQPSNTDFEITNCVRKTHRKGASNKKSIRWIFCLRARVNDASDYQWGVRLSTEKNLRRRRQNIKKGNINDLWYWDVILCNPSCISFLLRPKLAYKPFLYKQ
jgi:hypothetical protein